LNHLLASLPIKGPGYEEFITALTQIAYAACEEGAQQMEAAGKSSEDLQDDEDARRQFIAACHLGFARAQTEIGAHVIDLDAAIRAARPELSAAKWNRNKDKAKELNSHIESLTNRQLVLRRVVDYIYFTLLNREAHHYKRFFLHRRSKGISRRRTPETLITDTRLARPFGGRALPRRRACPGHVVSWILSPPLWGPAVLKRSN